MKKLFTTLTLCITVLTTSMASFADPPFDRGHGQKGPKGGPRGEWNDRGHKYDRDDDEDRFRDERRMRTTSLAARLCHATALSRQWL